MTAGVGGGAITRTDLRKHFAEREHSRWVVSGLFALEADDRHAHVPETWGTDCWMSPCAVDLQEPSIRLSPALNECRTLAV